MTSVKVKFSPSAVAGHDGSIYYQVLHDRKPRRLSTDYKIFPSEWDEKRGQVKAPKDSPRRLFILSIHESIDRDIERFTKIDRRLYHDRLNYTADDIIDEFRRYREEYTLFNYMKKIIFNLKYAGRLRTSETYRSALNSFKNFLSCRPQAEDCGAKDDIMLDCITSGLMEEYEAWLKSRGLIPNSIGFYMRILRAVYNRAVDEGIIENRNPFRKVYTGVDKTVKRALPVSIIKKMIALNLSGEPALDFARDMFIISFYLRGISFIDLAFLKKSDLQNGTLTYRRRKTGQRLTVAWMPEMQRILDKYPPNPTEYLMPVVTRSDVNERNIYRHKAYNINRNLKIIAKKVGINVPLTLYVSRHSWASAAKANGIPVSIISEGMGHDSETTTQIYLASLDTSAVDKANRVILSSLIR